MVPALRSLGAWWAISGGRSGHEASSFLSIRRYRHLFLFFFSLFFLLGVFVLLLPQPLSLVVLDVFFVIQSEGKPFFSTAHGTAAPTAGLLDLHLLQSNGGRRRHNTLKSLKKCNVSSDTHYSDDRGSCCLVLLGCAFVDVMCITDELTTYTN